MERGDAISEPVNSSRNETSNHQWWLWAILVGVALFYVPFISRQFCGDDWLWLANAKRAIGDPIIFLQRPMYGYFRPLNMVIICVLRFVFGDHAIIFSLVNILLHVANVWLLGKVLERFGLPAAMKYLAMVFFGFYFLNAPAIEWISVGHDLWVTGLCLLVVLKSLEAVDKPRWSIFAQIWLLGMAATLIKESGFVSIGLFWLVLSLKGKSPFGKPYRWFTLLSGLTYAAFLIGYATTRTIADREVALNLGTLVNLWYFLTYLVTPFARRVVEVVPAELVWVLNVIKIAATILLPLIAVYLWRKGGAVCRLFLLWSIAFVSTIAIMTWDVGLFSLYSERTAARFMYSPVIGVAVCLAWFGHKAATRFRILFTRYVVLVGVAIFVAFNWLAVRQVSGLYLENQRISNTVINAFTAAAPEVAACDSVVILTDDLKLTPSLVISPPHLEAILYVWFDRVRKVSVREQNSRTGAGVENSKNRVEFRWNQTSQLLDLVSRPGDVRKP